jgi:hypothetical protein
MAFMGTAVTAGSGEGVVVGTGEQSQIGSIAQDVRASGAEKTPLQQRTDRLAKWIAGLLLIIVVISFDLQKTSVFEPMALFRGPHDACSHRCALLQWDAEAHFTRAAQWAHLGRYGTHRRDRDLGQRAPQAHLPASRRRTDQRQVVLSLARPMVWAT